MTAEESGEKASARSGASDGGSVYSIGAVASMVGVPPATLRTWEERYGVVVPARTPAGHRLYSRAQVEQLRFIAAEMERGASAADAHRLLSRRTGASLRHVPGAPAPRMLILIAERDQFSAELVEFLLRTEGFQVELTLDLDEAKRRFEQAQPDLTLIEFMIGGGAGEELCRWMKQHSNAPALVVSPLDVADRALQAGADAFLAKPVGHLRLISTVKDLLGLSAMVKPGASGS